MPAIEVPVAGLIGPETEDNLQQQFLDNNWTDKLPIVLPTRERVDAMLKGTSHPPDEIVGHLQPVEFRAAWEYTVEQVAVNAVMAGARPEYFPVILALAASELSARSSSSSSSAMMVVVNGPIRRDRHELRRRRHGSVQSRQRNDRPRLRAVVAEPAGRLGARRDLYGLAGQQLRLQQYHLCGERGEKSLGAAARAKGVQADRLHREHFFRLPLDDVLPGAS